MDTREKHYKGWFMLKIVFIDIVGNGVHVKCTDNSGWDSGHVQCIMLYFFRVS